MKKKQKDIFITSEGDAWFERNYLVLSRRNYDEKDPVINAVDTCLTSSSTQLPKDKTLLEVGCGDGKRLKWLQENRNISCSGVEPSSKATTMAASLGVHAVKGSADLLPFADNQFDIVVFGFCLYLCDREDLFKIAYEADRVLKSNAWLIIHDFFSDHFFDASYHHLDGVRSFKMDYRKLWDWNPAYTCFSHHITHHDGSACTDDKSEWVATSILRKRS